MSAPRTLPFRYTFLRPKPHRKRSDGNIEGHDDDGNATAKGTQVSSQRMELAIRKRARSQSTTSAAPNQPSRKRTKSIETTKSLKSNSTIRNSSRSRSRHTTPEIFASPEPDPWTLGPCSEAKSRMPPEIAEQYQVAGLPYHEPLPRGRFPHSRLELADPAYSYRAALTKSEIAAELAKLRPPPKGMIAGQPQSQFTAPGQSAKLRAVAVLQEQIHSLLRRGDYKRAARAFGLLLRTRVHGHGIDLRSPDTWGIGVEILCRSGNAAVTPPRIRQRLLGTTEDDDDEDDEASLNPPDPRRWRVRGTKVERRLALSDDPEREAEILEADRADLEATRRYTDEVRRRPAIDEGGWEQAREFFELLVSQFPPNSRDRPDRTGAVEIYYGMYTTWLVHIEEMRRADMRAARTGHNGFSRPYGDGGPQEDYGDDEDDDTAHLTTNPPTSQSLRAMTQAVTSALGRATALAQHMDALTTSLPYSDSHDLISLRARTERWLAELCVPLHLRLHVPDDFENESDTEDYDDGREAYVCPWDRRGRLVVPARARAARQRRRKRGVKAKVKTGGRDGDADAGSASDVSGAGQSDDNENDKHDHNEYHDDGDENGGTQQTSSYFLSDEDAELLKHVRTTREAHIREAKRLMGRSDYLRRTAHLRGSTLPNDR